MEMNSSGVFCDFVKQSGLKHLSCKVSVSTLKDRLKRALKHVLLASREAFLKWIYYQYNSRVSESALLIKYVNTHKERGFKLLPKLHTEEFKGRNRQTKKVKIKNDYLHAYKYKYI